MSAPTAPQSTRWSAWCVRWRWNWPARGVTVNAVCPGFTDTDLVAGSIDNIMKKTGRSREQAVAELAKHNPQGRLVTPAEVADTVLWLCGEGASAITGQAIAVAGGEI